MSEFLSKLRVLLEETDQIGKGEVKKAAQLVKQRRWELSLRREGPCLACGAAGVQYGRPCTTHISRGDGWLDLLFTKWKEPPTIGRRYNRHLIVNNYKVATISPYLCEGCHSRLMERLDEFEKAERQKKKEQLRKAEEHEIALIKGEVKGTPAKRLWALQSHISGEEIKRLKEMPYQEFLDTIYWDVVRRYVLWKRKYKCELCGENGKLNVHHKSYDHRGEEYNYLEDLIVLCHPCHAKFHDKLAA